MTIINNPWPVRLIVWSFVCIAIAFPSLLLASQDHYDNAGLAAAIAIAAIIHTVVSGLHSARRAFRRPFFRRTAWITYCIAVALSIIPVVGILIQFIPGLLAVSAVESIAGRNNHDFPSTLATALLEGIILYALMMLLGLIIWGLHGAPGNQPDIDDGRCANCDYDLRASHQFGRCPECGTPLSEPLAAASGSAPAHD